CLQYFSSPFTF
nr:immunoglobulin light chain junction region [Macaca mulatta]MOV62394.1 immunoglobulin light chain junction region [Macaca mulatta]MOV64247.1 immunoglobulin light chain junction region [Macaca mulatta]MOV64688.1 immunoglobulin light chain junction region [Macaca mulatta]MOV65107.1 immunoglobulin light chain junction region [Macaca mulatta]